MAAPTPREKAIRLVVSLSNQTVDRGATEGEEENATRIARGLIAKYELTIDEVAEAERAEALRQGPRYRQPPPEPVRPMAASWGTVTGQTSASYPNDRIFTFRVTFE